MIEVADYTFAFDLGTKAQLYAPTALKSFGLSTQIPGYYGAHRSNREWMGNVRQVQPTELLYVASLPRLTSGLPISTEPSHSAACCGLLVCPSRRLSDFTSSSAASAITVPGGKIASAPAVFSAS